VSVDGVEIDDQSSPISWDSVNEILNFNVDGIDSSTTFTVTFTSDWECLGEKSASFEWSVVCGPCVNCPDSCELGWDATFLDTLESTIVPANDADFEFSFNLADLALTNDCEDTCGEAALTIYNDDGLVTFTNDGTTVTVTVDATTLDRLDTIDIKFKWDSDCLRSVRKTITLNVGCCNGCDSAVISGDFSSLTSQFDAKY